MVVECPLSNPLHSLLSSPRQFRERNFAMRILQMRKEMHMDSPASFHLVTTAEMRSKPSYVSLPCPNFFPLQSISHPNFSWLKCNWSGRFRNEIEEQSQSFSMSQGGWLAFRLSVSNHFPETLRELRCHCHHPDELQGTVVPHAHFPPVFPNSC